ncbi:hypothetical protein BC828DRAFT_418695 [Blastocladiella britannica]|nr:hypothetical protein BC828DRAFT_418695 [Blastocladiella britannica]
MICAHVCVLVRMDAQYIVLVAYASTRGSGEALNVLLAWKTRTGWQMFTLEQTPPHTKYWLETALVHPHFASRPDFANWLLLHAMATDVAGSTAVHVDSRPDMSPTIGIAMMRSLLVQSAGGDTDMASGLIAGFQAMPPVVVRNALVSFAPVATSELAGQNLDLVLATLSIDPPGLSMVLDHEAVQFQGPLPSDTSQRSMSPPPHLKLPYGRCNSVRKHPSTQ